MKLRIGPLFACLLAATSVQAAPKASISQASPQIPLVIGRIQTPKMDGKISPSEWKGAGVIKEFFNNVTGKTPLANSSAYIGYDDKAIYIGMISSEPFMNKLAANSKTRGSIGDSNTYATTSTQNVTIGRDRDIWSNDCMELYVNPTADRVNYYHFIADTLGQKYDALGADPYGYNPEWQIAAYKGDKFWSIEVAIPFSSLNCTTPKSGDLWYGLVGRERQPVAELTSSNPTFGAFDSPGRFGTWVFGSLKVNMQKQVASLKKEGKGWPAQMASDKAAWSKKLQAFQTKVDASDEKTVQASYPTLTSSLDQLKKEADPLKVKALSIAAGGKAFFVTKAYPYQPFTGERIISGEPVGPMDLTILQDEWKDIAFNITNLSDSTITLRCTTRHGNESSDFATLGLYGVDTVWQQAYAVAAGDGQKVYDAIVPTSAGTIQIPAGTTSQIWLSVHAPKNASGTTAGRVVIQPIDGSTGDPLSLPIKVTTVPVSLTANSQIHCFTWNALLFPVDKYPQLAKAYYTDLKEHGVNLTMLSNARHFPHSKANPDGTLKDKLDFTTLDNVIDASKGIIDQYYLTMDMWEPDWYRKDMFGLDWNDPALPKAFKAWWSQVLDHLKAKGVTGDQLFVNPMDESSDERFTRIAKWVKAVDPAVRTIIDSHGGNELTTTRNPKAMSDVWMPHYTQYFDAVYQKNIEIVRESKLPLWVYYYSESGNEKRMDPTPRYLAKFWWAYDNGLTGVGYWAQQLYGDPWYRKPYSASYDTSLSYPTETGVIPSRRWQAWRQGWQDYCLLTLAKETMQKSGDTAGIKELDSKVKDTLANAIDPAKTEAVRNWLKSKLVSDR